MPARIIAGYALDALRTPPDLNIDSVATDPPGGIAMMGLRWAYDVRAVDVWHECLRVPKPGGYLLACASPRTYNRMAVAIGVMDSKIRDRGGVDKRAELTAAPSQLVYNPARATGRQPSVNC